MIIYQENPKERENGIETVDADQLAGKKRKKTKASAGEASKEGADAEILAPAKAATSRAEGTKSVKGIRFMDDEYPTLATESTGGSTSIGAAFP